MIVYGPVLSWRFGRSLGIDLIQPPKTCTLDCIYCQLGQTQHKICSRNEFSRRIDIRVLEDELNEKIECVDVDVITLSGSGEPTLNPQLGEVIDVVRGSVKKPLIILTNSSLLIDVAEDLRKLDLVEAKLDAVTQDTFVSVNRPCEYMRIHEIKESIKNIRAHLSIQSMFFRHEGGVPLMREFSEYICYLKELKPLRVDVNTPWRPPQNSEVEPLREQELSEICEKIRNEGIDARYYKESDISHSKKLNIDELIEILSRRPLRMPDIAKLTGLSGDDVLEFLNKLSKEYNIKSIFYQGEMFYRV
jgi:wyosine [tRNA(Phe)-imidazoG37] synthetase (radical SAM superfamily)